MDMSSEDDSADSIHSSRDDTPSISIDSAINRDLDMLSHKRGHCYRLLKECVDKQDDFITEYCPALIDTLAFVYSLMSKESHLKKEDPLYFRASEIKQKFIKAFDMKDDKVNFLH